jgi:cytoskeletal protein RodZ
MAGTRGAAPLVLGILLAGALGLAAGCGRFGSTPASSPPAQSSAASSPAASSDTPAAATSSPAAAASSAASSSATSTATAAGPQPIPKTGAATWWEGAALVLAGAGFVGFGWRRLRYARR